MHALGRTTVSARGHVPLPPSSCSPGLFRCCDALIAVAPFTRSGQLALLRSPRPHNACNLVESRPRQTPPLDSYPACLRLGATALSRLALGADVTVAWPSRNTPRDPTSARHDALRLPVSLLSWRPGASDTLDLPTTARLFGSFSCGVSP